METTIICYAGSRVSGLEGMEKIETTIMGSIGTTLRICSFIPS